MSFVASMTDFQRKALELLIATGVAVAVGLGAWNLKTTHDLSVGQAAIKEKVESMQSNGTGGLRELTRENAAQHSAMMEQLSVVKSQVSRMDANIEWLIRDRKSSSPNRKGAPSIAAQTKANPKEDL